jgi:hypothetical protein
MRDAGRHAFNFIQLHEREVKGAGVGADAGRARTESGWDVMRCILILWLGH